MHSRSDLQTILMTICNNVYYQPPESVRMTYPAIVYERRLIDNIHANDNVYGQKKSYEVTVIDKNPDSMIVDRVSKLPYCSHNRHYTADNLNHDVFIIYY